MKLINKKGVYNIGGKTKTVFNFVKKQNKNIKKKLSKGEFPLNQDMNLSKLNVETRYELKFLWFGDKVMSMFLEMPLIM